VAAAVLQSVTAPDLAALFGPAASDSALALPAPAAAVTPVAPAPLAAAAVGRSRSEALAELRASYAQVQPAQCTT